MSATAHLAPALALTLALAACGSSPEDDELRVPELGPVPEVPTFADDPLTPAKLELGRALYFDVRLSGSGKTNCDSCHIHTTNLQDNLPLSTPDRSFPADSPTVTRNTPSFLNMVYAPVTRWDGSHTDLVEVLAFPFAEPNMNTALLPVGDPTNDVPAAQQALVQKLTQTIPGYVARFQDAFGVDIASATLVETWRLTGRALRAFLTLAVSRDAPFDRWNAGDDSAMDAAAVRGLALFRGKGRCIACHSGPLFTDFAYHNLSTSPPRADGTRADEGRFLVTGQEADRGAFLTPTLRQVFDTSPYFHDGAKFGLRDTIRHLASDAVTADPNHDPLFATPLELSDDEITDLIAFLRALRGAPVSLDPPAPGSLP
ncbi:MAG: cytochrome c peroxidase [Kofleriaceae bacterium]